MIFIISVWLVIINFETRWWIIWSINSLSLIIIIRDISKFIPVNYKPPEGASKGLQFTNFDISWEQDEAHRKAILRPRKEDEEELSSSTTANNLGVNGFGNLPFGIESKKVRMVSIQQNEKERLDLWNSFLG